MSGGRAHRAYSGAARLCALAFVLVLGGCSIPIGEIQLGSQAERPKDSGGYLPVNQLPPDRDEAAMNAAERAKVQAELIAARERQASAAAGKYQPASKDQNQAPK